jgi:hypothetical protein
MLARQQALGKPIKIEPQKALDLPDVGHDGDQIHQLLLNLVLNASASADGRWHSECQDRSTSTRWLCQRRNPRHRPGIPPNTSPTSSVLFIQPKETVPASAFRWPAASWNIIMDASKARASLLLHDS